MKVAKRPAVRVLEMVMAMLLLVTMGSGCSPNDDRTALRIHNLLGPAIWDLRDSPGQLFTSQQLKALAGDPEMVMDVKGFLALVREHEGESAYLHCCSCFEIKSAGPSTALLPAGSGGQGPASLPWSGKSEVWVYAWRKPWRLEAMAIGGTIALTSFPVTIRTSVAYLIVDGKVVRSVSLQRET